MVAVAIVGAAAASLGGAAITAGAASDAADAQTAAANQANATQQQQYNQTRNDLLPYQQAGQVAAGQLNDSRFTDPIKMDQATLEATPGYQFNLEQGLKSVQNSAAARGLGTSGAAFKGAASYATGLADNTYQNQFNNANTNITNAYNRLRSTAGLGESAAAKTGDLGQSSANAQSSATIGAGNAQAAAANATGAAFNNGLNGASNALFQGAFYNKTYGGGSNYFGPA